MKKTRRSTPGDPFSAAEHAHYESLRTTDIALEGDPDLPPDGAQRWSTWADTPPMQRGPEPLPDWVITATGAVDHELGVLKTGKEADVHLIERAIPHANDSTLMASKRYRTSDHSLFHRSNDYTVARGVKKSREKRALERKSRFGRELAAGRWANAEFAALCLCYEEGIAVPYPVQVHGRELIMEYIGDERQCAPRLADLAMTPERAEALWEQVDDNVELLAHTGYAHGDLSAYNIVVDENDDILFVDLPQIVDVYANPKGFEFLNRDIDNIGRWFISKGLDPEAVEECRARVMAVV